MAMKAAVAAALVMALVALATATPITTTSLDEENWQQCWQQVQRRQFRPCTRFLQQRSGPFNGEEEEATGNLQQQQYLQECCQQLKDMERRQCGCEAIRHAVRKAQLQQLGGRSYDQIYDRARALPRRCNMHNQQCRFRLVFV